MSALEKIKLEASKLNPEEQAELFKWWITSETFKERQLAALQRDLALGISQLDAGRYQTYDAKSIMSLAEDIGKKGRERLEREKKSLQ